MAVFVFGPLGERPFWVGMRLEGGRPFQAVEQDSEMS